ncbi:hypothetical protein AAU57_05025 [Nonlabens sp. YIK11]|nr:hypothetical protein AAU57_05025 [Nonlabens sp. YIK11]
MNQMISSMDTIVLKSKKVKGFGPFSGMATVINFRDTSDTFTQQIVYPNGLNGLKRLELKTDLWDPKSPKIEILEGTFGQDSIYVVDQNNNKDLSDDPVNIYKKMDWSKNADIIPITYSISRGDSIVQDSSWISIGRGTGDNTLLGKREYLEASFTIDKEEFQIGVFEKRNTSSFTYGYFPEAALLSSLGVRKDTIIYSDMVKVDELLNLNGRFYRFHSVSSYGDQIVLIRDTTLNTKIGTQIGMIAPSFKAITTANDTILSSEVKGKFTVIANTCGCGGDTKSTDAYLEIEERYGDTIRLLHVDSNIGESLAGVHIDSMDDFNQNFYNIYREQYCSRICYVIDRNNRIVDKFDIDEWDNKLPTILNIN